MKVLKLSFCILSFLLISNVSFSQADYSNDVSSLDNIIEALYEVISGDKGVKRDWARFEHLFTEDARLIPTRKDTAGVTGYRILKPQEYSENSGPYLEENGFFEIEITRTTETYGSMVHIWSTYESFRSSKDTEPIARGINSIQLLNDGERWWVMQIYWLGETDDNPLPAKYLE